VALGASISEAPMLPSVRPTTKRHARATINALSLETVLQLRGAVAVTVLMQAAARLVYAGCGATIVLYSACG
jgi:hypothetical protein